MITSRQRLDKWLWYARVVKSRTLAQKLVASGAVRVDASRVTSPDYRLSEGMVLTMTVNTKLRILKVVELGTRRGPALEAQSLYLDLTPQLPPRQKPDPLKGPPALRLPGSGRPTKKQRRETDIWTRKDQA